MMQERLQQKIHYTGNAKYVKDTLKVLDNDNSGIANKVVTKVLSVEGIAVEEEEFRKKTKLDISKDSLKQNVKDR